MNIIDFCNKHNILWEPIALGIRKDDNGQINKDLRKFFAGNYMPKTNDYQLDPKIIKDRQKFINSTPFIAIFTNIVQQIDIDRESDYYDDLKTKAPFFLSVTKQLPHYFFFIDNDDPSGLKKCIDIKCGDVLNGQWSYAHKDAVVFNADMPFPRIDINLLPKTEITNDRLFDFVNKSKEKYKTMEPEDKKKVLDCIYTIAYENNMKEPMAFIIMLDVTVDDEERLTRVKDSMNTLLALME
jgi:hypothetical protein